MRHTPSAIQLLSLPASIVVVQHLNRSSPVPARATNGHHPTNGAGATTSFHTTPGSGADRTPADEGKQLPEPVSPELVLVSPQLRLKALNALPDRPWETFLRPSPWAPPAGQLADADILMAEAGTPRAEDRSASIPRSGRRLGRDAWLVGVALVVGFMAAEFVPRSAGPSFEQAGGRTPSVSPSRGTPTPSLDLAPAVPTFLSPLSLKPRHATRRNTSELKVLAVPRGGYVSGRSVRFQIAANRRTVTVFQARVNCARHVVVRALSLHHGSRFSYRGRIRARDELVRLRVFGRFIDKRRVRGYVRARSAGCDSGKIRFLARLS
jgi:hypothetical protein